MEIFQLGELFEKVQLQRIFTDGKTFVDCTPLYPLDEILKIYNSQKTDPAFDLKKFIQLHFQEPLSPTPSIERSKIDLKEHLNALWSQLQRSPEVSHNSLIALPEKYIIPGGRFREIYYWDSYFTMLGLEVSGRKDIIAHMVKNFAYLIYKIGYIPNGNRSYYVGRSQPPFFACMVQLLSEIEGEEVIIKFLPHLLAEYKFWMTKRVIKLKEGISLNHYSDQLDFPRPESFKEDYELGIDSDHPAYVYRQLRAGAESGWDFSSRWFRDEASLASIHATEILPIDLNCLLYNLELLISDGYKLKNDMHNFESFKQAADSRMSAINKIFWNEEEGFYFDFDHITKKKKTTLTLAAAFPLFFNIALQDQADRVAKKLKDIFLMDGGLVTTLNETGQQWDAPNGWAPLQWIAIKGLMNYGHEDLAREIALRWMLLNEKVFANTGKMMEKYNVKDITLLAGGGEYPAQDGFGWTNGVYLKLNAMYK